MRYGSAERDQPARYDPAQMAHHQGDAGGQQDEPDRGDGLEGNCHWYSCRYCAVRSSDQNETNALRPSPTFGLSHPHRVFCAMRQSTPVGSVMVNRACPTAGRLVARHAPRTSQRAGLSARVATKSQRRRRANASCKLPACSGL